MKSAKIKHDYFVYPILRMGTIFFAKRRSRANEHLKNAHLQQLLFYMDNCEIFPIKKCKMYLTFYCCSVIIKM